jgi:DNA-binding PadR family transcriptional regulator
MTSGSHRRSPLAVVLLALLAEAPMHPYRMQQLIKERGKGSVANVAQRNSVYQTIDRLERSGLIAVRETAREERRPERTIYEITDRGRSTFREWMRTMLSTPAREFPEFPAALASLMLLEPSDVLRQLEARVAKLEASLASTRESMPEGFPRVFLLDDEHREAVVRAELEWLRSVVEDLRSGELTWSRDWLRTFAEAGF